MLETIPVLVQIAPIFFAILFGVMLRRYFARDAAPWDMMNGLAYWFLFPLLLFHSVLSADFQYEEILPYLTVIFLAFMLTFVLVVVACRYFQFSMALSNSTVQAASRHNTFMALAICGVMMGEQGFAIATLATAFQVIVTNFCVMGYIASYTQEGAGKFSLVKIITNQLYNPFLLSILLALSLKLLGIEYVLVISETAALLGRSALPLSLLATGAGLSFMIHREKIASITIAVVAKMILFPIFVLILGTLFDLSATYFLVALVYAAVPTAASSYVVARLTGGDAPVLSTMTMLQVMVSFVSFTLIVVYFDFSSLQ